MLVISTVEESLFRRDICYVSGFVIPTKSFIKIGITKNILLQQNVWFCQQNVWLLRQNFRLQQQKFYLLSLILLP